MARKKHDEVDSIESSASSEGEISLALEVATTGEVSVVREPEAAEPVAPEGGLVYEGPAATIHGVGTFAPGATLEATVLAEIATRLGVTPDELAQRLVGKKGFKRQ